MEKATDLGVLAACEQVMSQARHLRIDDAAMQTRVEAWGGHFAVPAWNRDLHYHDGTERTVNYVLVLDALNFSFWPDPHKERWSVFYGGEEYSGYWGLAAALRRALEGGIPLCDADYLAGLTGGRLAHILKGRSDIPMMGERLAHLREIGRVLQKHCDGQFARMVEAADGSALRLVSMVAEQFKSFHDVSRYHGAAVPLLKRAQILAVDLAGTFGFERWGKFHDLHLLTAFADYKLPQILRSWGMLVYDPILSERVDTRRPIPPGDPMEVEIRAATIVAVERLRQALNGAIQDGRPPYKAYEIDWGLWQAAQEAPPSTAPYHLTRTIYY